MSTTYPPPVPPEAPPPNLEEPQGQAAVDQSHRLSRGATVRAAVAGLDKFKQSWVSIMLLKGSIGLGQIVALLVLLILSTTSASPLSPHLPQSRPSQTCPRPQLFQAWMAVNMTRLAICWAVSCWICIRHRRSRFRAELEARHADEETHSVEPSPQVQVSHAPSSTLPFSASAPPLSESVSSASASTATLTSSSSQHSHSPGSTPDTVYTPRMGSVVFGDALSHRGGGTKDPRGFTLEMSSQSFPSHWGAQEHARREGVRPSQVEDTLRAARALHVAGEEGTRIGRWHVLASWLDRWALTISKTLGAISAVLFILGNVLLFYPNPASQTTCYHSAPLLWWGVMTVTGVGWILLGQVFFVVVIVGIGGQAVLVLLRTVGIIPPPEQPVVRKPQPEVLTLAELKTLKLVIYLPDPEEYRRSTEVAAEGEEMQQASQLPKPDINVSRLYYPPIYLPSHRATCAVCQENFELPQEGKTIMLKAAPLRLLGCGHVYHAECIDQWLLEGSGNCPFCNQAVRETLNEMTPNPTGEDDGQARCGPVQRSHGWWQWRGA